MTTGIILVAVVIIGIVIYKSKGGNGPQNPTSGGQSYGSSAGSTGGGSYSGNTYGADGVQR